MCVASPPSLGTPRPGEQGDGESGSVLESGFWGPPDLRRCLPPSTVAAEQMLCPGERKEFVIKGGKMQGGLK